MTTSPGSVAIEATDLVKAYPGGVRALDGVTFAVGEGEVFALLGPNGAGKTTTVKILTTLCGPTSGVARVAGLDVVREPARVRKAIGVVSQQSGIDPTATGRENLVLQGRFFGLGGRELNRRIDQLLAVVGLTDAAKRMAAGPAGSISRWASSTVRASCASTSRRRVSTPRSASRCGTRSGASPPRNA